MLKTNHASSLLGLVLLAVTLPISGCGDSYSSMTAKELAIHINEKLIPGQGTVIEGRWQNLYEHVMADRYNAARTFFPPSDSTGLFFDLLKDGECKDAVIALGEKIAVKE